MWRKKEVLQLSIPEDCPEFRDFYDLHPSKNKQTLLAGKYVHIKSSFNT